MVNILRDTNKSRPVECVLCLLLFDYLQMVSLYKCNMSMVTTEYIYGIWSIRDNCYECRVIRSLDMRSFTKAATRTSTWFTILFGLDKLPVP